MSAKILEPKQIEDPIAPEPVTPSLAALAGLDFGFKVVDGFSRPDWRVIGRYLQSHVTETERGTAWEWVVHFWLRKLASDLGENCRVRQTNSFFTLSDVSPDDREAIINYAEKMVRVIREYLRGAAWSGFPGKHVLLLFSEAADYYAYISYFYPDGVHPQSSGVFLSGGYAHIAICYEGLRPAQHTLVYELVHNLLCHLEIPLWLSEGLAQAIEYRLAGRNFLMDREWADRHAHHWNETNIQAFWTGRSFQEAGSASELSFNLAHVLVHLLWDRGPEFITFIQKADWQDAGQIVALDCLGTDLGNLVEGFLGPGQWRPNRKAMRSFD